MDMLTTAVVMSAGREQAGVLPVSSDRAQAKGSSFAKSFDEEVALAVDTKASSDEGVAEARALTNGAPLQVPGELAVKKAGAFQAGAVSESDKSVAVMKSVNGPLVSIVPDAKTSAQTSGGIVTTVDAANSVLDSQLVPAPVREI